MQVACEPFNPVGEPLAIQLTVSAVDTLISTESGLLAQVVDISVSPAGVVHVLEAANARIVQLDPSDPARPRLIGREGIGPGEFYSPIALRATADGFVVADYGLGLQRLRLDGSFISSRSLSSVSPLGLSLSGDGSITAGTNGMDSALALLYDGSGKLVGRVGAPVVPLPLSFDPNDVMREMAEGKIPNVIRNQVLTATDERLTCLALQSEAEVQCYDHTLALVSRRKLEDEALPPIFAAFVKNNAEARSVRPLRYFADIEIVGDELWTLLNVDTASAAVVLRIPIGDGPVRRITIPAVRGATQFAYHEPSRALYLYTRDDAQLLRASIAAR